MTAFMLALFWLVDIEDEPTWWVVIPIAGALLAIGFVSREILVAIRLRKSGTRHFNQHGVQIPSAHNGQNRLDVHAAGKKLRALQRNINELETAGMTVAKHKEAILLCEKYLAEAQEAMRAEIGVDVRAALRSGVERITIWHKQHLLTWTRLEAQNMMHEAQRRVRVSDKIETAGFALEVIKEALRHYPQEPELLASADAVRDLIASVKIGHWVELAERAAFRGKYVRALARYQDAMFYLARAEMSETARNETIARLNREIDILRARMASEATTRQKVERTVLATDSQNHPTNHLKTTPAIIVGAEEE
ncbi:MAG: hypothetical protein NVSMB56_09380 [Pyrinomonadaceae bacterium]